tara:strand:- start:53 stop:280 length:228 start_codon:yes stop_codon:yes gene_type:complete
LYSFIPLFCRAIKDFPPCIKDLAPGMMRLTEALERLELAGLALRDPVRLTEALERLELAGLALLLVGLTLLRVRL